jgi:hypothetical protein
MSQGAGGSDANAGRPSCVFAQATDWRQDPRICSFGIDGNENSLSISQDLTITHDGSTHHEDVSDRERNYT